MKHPLGAALLLAAAFFLGVASPRSSAAPAISAGVAYDEIVWQGSPGGGPSPGSFSADRAGLALLQSSLDRYPAPAQAQLPNVANEGATSSSGFTRFYRYSYLGSWERIDDPIASTATIVRPDLSEIIHVDSANKTYRIIAGNDYAKLLSDAATRGTESTSPERQDAPNPDYRSEVSIVQSDERTIDGLAAVGYVSTASLSTVRASRACMDEAIETRYVYYYAADVAAQQDAPAQTPGVAILQPGCTTARLRSGPALPNDRVFLYCSTATTIRLFGKAMNPIVRVVERGNVVRLTSANASLFAAPAKYAAVP